MEVSDAILMRQWDAFVAWLGASGIESEFEQPSSIEGWTIAELVAHLGRSLTMLEAVVPAPDAEPGSFLTYVSEYAAAADDISEGTRALAVDLSADVVAGVVELGVHGLTALGEVTAPVVRGPRGLITRSDLVLTRVLELVVHGDDLARSVRVAPPPPLLDDAVAAVSDGLARAYVERTGVEPPYAPGLDWIRLASGRTHNADPALPLL